MTKAKLPHIYSEWLDANCDFKRHHTGPVPLPELGGKHYECDYWYFVIDRFENTDTPAIVVKVGHEPISDYMEVNVENNQEDGTVDGQAFLGLFPTCMLLSKLVTLLRGVNS